METNNDYHFSLFTPNSPYTRKIRNIVLSILLIWALAVFGFQILLRVIEKPTPEKAFTLFESVWEDVKSGNPSIDDKNSFSTSLSFALGKSSLKKEHREPLVNALNWSIYSIADSSDRSVLTNSVNELRKYQLMLSESKKDLEFSAIKEKMEAARTNVLVMIEKITLLKSNSLEAGVIAFNLKSEFSETISEADTQAIPLVMNTYLVHNQSILTNTKFLGFPFHYFYTSIFLLVMFVLLCLIFSLSVDRLQKKFNIVE